MLQNNNISISQSTDASAKPSFGMFRRPTNKVYEFHDNGNNSSSKLLDDCKLEKKPKLRGQFHHFAFYLNLVLGIYFYVSFMLKIYHTKQADSKPQVQKLLAFVIYVFSLLMLYGVSSILHLYQFVQNRIELIVQKLDHCNIYLLIAGTYTAVCYICLPIFEQSWVSIMLIIAWSIAVLGCIKTVFWLDAPVLVNVLLYFLTGCVILPFIGKVIRNTDILTSTLFEVGGGIYLAGGLIYGFQSPDPFPNVFGHHEIFHILTILGNSCFFVPIVMKF